MKNWFLPLRRDGGEEKKYHVDTITGQRSQNYYFPIIILLHTLQLPSSSCTPLSAQHTHTHTNMQTFFTFVLNQYYYVVQYYRI